MLSTEHELQPGSPQHKFVVRDLAEASKSSNRAHRPWLLVAMHRPMYVDSVEFGTPDTHQGFAIYSRAQLEALLNEHKVDLVLSGHVHAYQRMCNIQPGGNCTTEGKWCS